MGSWATAALLFLLPVRACLQAARVSLPALHNAIQTYLAWSLAWEHTGDRGCSEAVLLSIPLATVFQGNVKETEF